MSNSNLNPSAEAGAPIDGDEINLFDLLLVIVANLRLLILAPIAIGLITLGYSFTVTPTFTAKTTLIPPGQISGGGAALLGQLGGLASFAGGAIGIKSQTDQYIAFLESNNLQDVLIEKFSLMERYKAKLHQQARDALKKASKITIDKKSGFIQIEVSDSDPQFAANLANGYVWALSNMMGRLILQEAKAKRGLLEQQIAEATEKSYRSPFVRDAIIQAVIREYEMAVLDEKKDKPFLQQIDIAEVPEFKVAPRKAMMAIIATVTTEFALLLFIFARHSWLNLRAKPQTEVGFIKLQRLLKKQFTFKVYKNLD